MDLMALAPAWRILRHFLNLTTSLSAWFVRQQPKEFTEVSPTSMAIMFRDY
jgi:hypothetical protein